MRTKHFILFRFTAEITSVLIKDYQDINVINTFNYVGISSTESNVLPSARKRNSEAFLFPSMWFPTQTDREKNRANEHGINILILTIKWLLSPKYS